MLFLVDTNVLLRSVDGSHPMNADASNAVGSLLDRGEQLSIIAQNIIEFWNVYTRPIERNGLGHTPIEAEREVNRIKGIFNFLLDTPQVYEEWERLVVTYRVSGANVHDARLVAAMSVHSLTHILTFNTSDFTRYGEITAVHPTAIFS